MQPFVPTANKLTAKERALAKQQLHEQQRRDGDADQDEESSSSSSAAAAAAAAATTASQLPFSMRRVPLGASMIRSWVSREETDAI